MKLNYPRVLLVGMAFFLISAFWVAYDAIIPLVLTNHFGLPQTASGAVMSIDNVLAVFLLPIFGALSDKKKTRFGKRTPFIFFGTIAAVISFVCLTFIDNYQIARVVKSGITEIDRVDKKVAPEAIELTLKLTLENPWPLVGFIATLLVVLISMATFRSPAVALMPDVTVKPLRSKANAIINLTGTAGGMLVLVLGMIFGTSKPENLYMQYTGYVMAVCGVMLLGFILFLTTVKENKWAAEMEADTVKYGIEDTVEEESGNAGVKLSKPELKSLIFILASVALWYIGYNSITSKYTVYATSELKSDFNSTLIIAQGAAIIAFIPVGILASKIGRKKTILMGVLLLASAFAMGTFITGDVPPLIMSSLFALAGIGWATINVNSFPMVVELAKNGDIGKYTGYYYTASMAAQIVAPILSGVLYDEFGMRYMFFPFGAVFVLGSFVTMLFVKHGDSKPIPSKSALEQLDVDN